MENFFERRISRLQNDLAPKIKRHKMFLGVCAGIGKTYSFPVVLVRFLFILLSFPFGLGIVAYFILALVSKKQ